MGVRFGSTLPKTSRAHREQGAAADPAVVVAADPAVVAVADPVAIALAVVVATAAAAAVAAAVAAVVTARVNPSPSLVEVVVNAEVDVTAMTSLPAGEAARRRVEVGEIPATETSATTTPTSTTRSLADGPCSPSLSSQRVVPKGRHDA